MNSFLVVFATIVAAVSARVGRQGWGSSTPEIAPPLPPPGWNAPPVSSATIEAAGELAANGSGWAASTQDGELLASTNTPDGEDPSQVSQLGYIGQVTSNNPEIVLGVQVVDVEQLAIGTQAVDASAWGGNYASIGLNGWSGAAGEAESSADATMNVLVNKP